MEVISTLDIAIIVIYFGVLVFIGKRASATSVTQDDYFTGGTLAFNAVTIYDPNEEFRRTSPGDRRVAEGGTKNENDGGLIRHVYSGHRQARW